MKHLLLYLFYFILHVLMS